MEKHYLGLDVGGTFVKGGIVDAKGNIKFKKSIPTYPEKGSDAVMADIISLAKSLIFDNGLDYSDIAAAGMGIPGSVYSEAGVVVDSYNICFFMVPVVEMFTKEIPLPTVIDNDANAAALGEAVFANEEGYRHMVFITLGTGVGGGVIIDGKIYSGNKNVGAEVGHMSIMVDGRVCNCGNIGCWEQYASATALVADTTAKIAACPDSLLAKIAQKEGKVTAKTAFEARRQGDKAGAEVVDDYVKYVGTGLGNLANIFRPEAILIGGGVSHEGQYFIDMLQEYTTKCLYSAKAAAVKVKRAKLLNDAGILGAAALAIEYAKKINE